MHLFEMFADTEVGPPEPTLIDAFRDFLPIAVEHLKLDHIPKIKLVKSLDGTTFGHYNNDNNAIHVVVDNRNPVDILRTIAHEIVHYKQGLDNQLSGDSGETGSPIEDEANAEAGVIMRIFAQEYPKYLTLPAVAIPDQIEEKRQRKKKSKPRRYGGYYGYYYGGTNTGSEGSGDGGGGESIQEGLGKSALVGVLAAALSMVASPAQAEPSDAAKALGIYRMVNRYKNYDRAALEGEASQELNNILRAIQGHPDQSKLLPIIKKMIKTDDNGTLPTNVEELPPLTLPGDEVNENFADGKNPRDKGDSARHGIPKGATMDQLEKAAKAPGRKGQLARWQLNMRRGKKK